ncbi:MAG: phytoene desaturase family protein [Alkalispirochaetaceae bacterium]
MKQAVVIGSGFGGLSAAGYLAREGYDVTVVEKNGWVGGRARVLEREGFRFDMGPSWYWMPGEHDNWFRDMGVERADYYELRRVDPSYKVYYGDSEPREKANVVTMPADLEEAKRVFERYEPGAGQRLEAYLEACRRKYELAMATYIYQNYDTLFDFVNMKTIRNLGTLNIARSYKAMIQRYFKHPYLRKILEFPVVFLGSSARNTPAIYTLMNYIDFVLGTWYPSGGFGRVVEAMMEVDQSLGVRFRFNTPAIRLEVEKGMVTRVICETSEGEEALPVDLVVANADYHHVEEDLLPRESRSFSAAFWNRRSLAPGVLNFYIGLNKKFESFAHHTFFFDSDWDAHFKAVYERPGWLEKPLFYVHVPSITDPESAPEGKEAVFILVPIAPGLEETEETRKRYLDEVVGRIEALTGESFREHIEFVESYSLREFVRDFNAYKGNAFGLGQTLFQTAYFRTANYSRKVSNLYFSGHYTVPGTGTTMSTISGNVVTKRIVREHPA